MKIYIAGPYSADNVLCVLDNIRKGIRLSTEILLLGHSPFCPWLDFLFQLFLRDGESLSVKDYYRYSIDWLLVSDILLVMPGWRGSGGTVEEIVQAFNAGIPIIFDIRDLPNRSQLILQEELCTKKKKSDSSNSLQESEASSLGLKIVTNLGTGYQTDNVYHPKGLSPTVMAQSGRKTKGSLLILDVSGQTKSTSTPVKSTEKDSEIKNSTKATSGKSPSQIYPTMTFSQVASLVKVFPLREGVRVFKTSQEELFSSRSVESLEIKDQATYSLRMLRDYFHTTQAELSQLYCFRWMSLGTMSNGRCVTLNISFLKTGKGSLSSVLEDEVDEKYYLSNEKLKTMFEHKKRHEDQGHGFGCIIKGKRDIASTVTATEIGLNTNLIKKEKERVSSILIDKRIRRLTPVECERLQGFPDNWTAGISDTQRYKMMGNAVSVPVITAIGKRILRSLFKKENK